MFGFLSKLFVNSKQKHTRKQKRTNRKMRKTRRRIRGG